MPKTHAELLRDYVMAASADNWFLARQICNAAGCDLSTEESAREDFSPEQRVLWQRLYDLAMELRSDSWKAEKWRELQRELQRGPRMT